MGREEQEEDRRVRAAGGESMQRSSMTRQEIQQRQRPGYSSVVLRRRSEAYPMRFSSSSFVSNRRGSRIPWSPEARSLAQSSSCRLSTNAATAVLSIWARQRGRPKSLS